jgi:hypothetical protein
MKVSNVKTMRRFGGEVGDFTPFPAPRSAPRPTRVRPDATVPHGRVCPVSSHAAATR